MPRTRRRVLVIGLLLVVALCASALVEHLLELRDAVRLTASDTFYAVGGRRVRYHQTGAGAPGPTVVLLNGLMASLEQWDKVQTALSTVAPSISYDQDGMGFSDPADGHDAVAGADELDQLLHAPDIAGPFVIVSFSSGSMVATVFAAKRPDLVKGVVFIDPTVRSRDPRAKTYRRIYLRPSVANPLEALVGYTRVRHAILDLGAPPPTAVSERAEAVIESLHHWVASAHAAMNLDRSADEADAARAARPFARIPIGVLTTMDPPENDSAREVLEQHRALAASSDRGIIRAAHGDHSYMVTDPVAVGSIVDLVRTIVDEVRSEAEGAVGRGSP